MSEAPSHGPRGRLAACQDRGSDDRHRRTDGDVRDATRAGPVTQLRIFRRAQGADGSGDRRHRLVWRHTCLIYDVGVADCGDTTATVAVANNGKLGMIL